jgi:O-antigen ligase
MKIGGMGELTPGLGGLEFDELKSRLPGWATRPWLVAVVVGMSVGAYTIGLSTQSSHWKPLLIIAALVPAVGIIVGDLRRLLLAALVFDVPFSVGHHFGYNLDAAKLGSLGGLDVSLTTLAVPTLYALWVGSALARRGDGTRPWLRPAIPLALYVGFAILSIRQASNPSLSVFELFMLVQSLMIFIYVASTVRSREDVVFMVVILSAAVLLEALLMLATFVTKHDFSFAGISTRIDPATSAGDNVSRVGGTVGGPNAAAAFLDLLLAPILSLALAPVRRFYRLIAWSAFVLGCVGMVLTLSRGGWIAVGLSCSIVVAYSWYRGWIPGLGPAAIVIALMAAMFIFRNELLVRFTSNDEGSASSRIPLMVLALHMIQDHPIFGVGANNFGINIASYATPEFGADWLYTVHNKYLLIWAEDGILALGAFITFLLTTLRNGWRCRKIDDRVLSSISVGLTTGLLAQMIHMSVDILNGRQQVQLLVIVAGLIAALVAIKRDADPTPNHQSRWDRAERILAEVRVEFRRQPVPVPVPVRVNGSQRRYGRY